MSSERIETYSVSYYAGGSNAPGYSYRAIIGLRRAGGGLIGAAYFHRDLATLPGSDSEASSGYISAHYSMDDFDHVVDVLRNEDPVYLQFVGGSWNHARITTSLEPVGEGES